MNTNRKNTEKSPLRDSSSDAADKASHGDFLFENNDLSSLPGEALLPALARRAVEDFVREGRVIEHSSVSENNTLLRQRAACFVSIKTSHRELRGCIGTVEPYHQTLAEELIANAINAATRDPRFSPVGEAELTGLRYSVDVLGEPEPAQFEDLDPSLFGVIVENETGTCRGLLLPDIEGVETPAQQVEIAARKAGISLSTRLKLYRFRVRRFREQAHFQQKTEQGANQMAHDKSQHTESQDDNVEATGLEPETYASATDELNPASDDRAVSYGEQGQYAPGGRYNELNVTSADRIDLDEQVDSALRNEKK